MTAAIDKSTADLRRSLLADLDLYEDARAHAWCVAGAQSLSIKNGRLVGLPDGWPRIVTDPNTYVRDYVDTLLYQQEETRR